MFRTSLLKSATRVAAAQPALRTAVRTPFITSRFATPTLSAVRCYASGSGLSQEEITGRIVDLLKNFDKVRGAGASTCRIHGDGKMLTAVVFLVYRFRMHQRYLSTTQQHFKELILMRSEIRFNPPRTSAMISVSIPWIPSRWLWR